jgi:ribosomal protein L7/L12
VKSIVNHMVHQLTQSELVKVVLKVAHTGDDYNVALAINNVMNLREQTWHEECRQLMAANKRAAAVKVCREATGWPLRGALDYVDSNFVRGPSVTKTEATTLVFEGEDPEERYNDPPYDGIPF